MSRIQDILAKADREGTTRVVAPVDGAVALDPTPFIASPSPVLTPTLAPAPAPAPAPTFAPPVTAAEPRTARAILHPALVAAIAPHSAVAEQYRAIRTRLSQREDGGPLRTVLVTSPGGREGKSVTAANLALTMAQEYQRSVVLVDADLRGSSVHKLFGVEAGVGLADVLAGEATLDDALVYLPDYRLTLLPAGRTPNFPTELLGSSAMRRTLDTLRARFDRILLDTPPVAPLADVGTIAPLADGAVMVVRAGMTQRPALDQALEVFEEHKLCGLVLNDAR